ncbi:glycosyltransferase [Glycomyces salinus]|uniref:glycosyltransferase n=1 Tax=Glycomyces salinus TaxID=980294 RepID=UPI0018EBE5C5|nr:glycosyltransferase [Glycomyces salinus]
MRLPRIIPSRLLRRRSARLPRAASSSSADVSRHEVPELLHVVATRHGIGVFDEAWFEYRQLLLERVTLASLDAQTSKNFVWMIVIDRDMPKLARKHLDDMIADRSYIRLVEVELKRDFKGEVMKWVGKLASKRGAKWVLTTRLDDDDAIHRDMIAKLQRESRAVLDLDEQRNTVFAPVLGCNWVPSELKGYRSFHPSPSMGLSLLEMASEFRTVYDKNHMKLASQLAPTGARIRTIDDDTMWWLYAHTWISDQHREGSNRRNRAYTHTHAFEFDEALLQRFGISLEGAELLKNTPEPEPADTTHYLTDRGSDLEREIVELRRALKRRAYTDDEEASRMRERIAELHAERKELHRVIVRSPGQPRPSEERVSE